MRLPIKKEINILVVISFSLLMLFCCTDQESLADTSLSVQHEMAYEDHFSNHSHEAHNDDHHDFAKVFYLSSSNSFKSRSSLFILKVFEISSSPKNILASQLILSCNSPPEKHRGSLPIYLQNSVLRI